MTKGMTTITLRDIQKIVQQIVEHFHPQQVILFGSYAHGAPTEDSDVDLLVVMETEEPPLLRLRASLQPLIILVRWTSLSADPPTWKPLWHAKASLPPKS
jgi:predicted nucleotidyltransferase